MVEYSYAEMGYQKIVFDMDFDTPLLVFLTKVLPLDITLVAFQNVSISA